VIVVGISVAKPSEPPFQSAGSLSRIHLSGIALCLFVPLTLLSVRSKLVTGCSSGILAQVCQEMLLGHLQLLELISPFYCCDVDSYRAS
jgi:hypothetical protein